MMAADVRAIIERLAEHGTAPLEGCHLFGVGYEDAFARLKKTYLEGRLSRGGSAEKFVIGPFGSGKTHFLRQFMEMARELRIVTSEVQLNKNIDFCDGLVVYKEIMREIRAPGSNLRGVASMMRACRDNVNESFSELPPDKIDDARGRWIEGLRDTTFQLSEYGRVARLAFCALERKDEDVFDNACRWLEGEVSDRRLAKAIGVTPVAKGEQPIHAKRSLQSLFQLMKGALFAGTVVGFDEAEQGLSVDKKTRDRIFSLLQSEINAIADLEGASALLVYALTPDLLEDMTRYAALQQRIVSPRAGFFQGNTYAPVIDLTERGDAMQELEQIGGRLLKLVKPELTSAPPSLTKDLTGRITLIAKTISDSDPSVSNRRTFVRQVAWQLLHAMDNNSLPDLGSDMGSPSEGEV